jgi:uracil-DNA glycosylase family 4
MDSNLNPRLRSIVLGRLESLERAGVLQLPVASSVAAPAALAAVPTAAPPAAMSPAVTRSAEERIPLAMAAGAAEHPSLMEGTPMTKTSPGQTSFAAPLHEACVEPPASTDRAVSLAVLQQEVAGCTRCSELASLRTQTVFGVGNPKARLCFMGEAPGADEDRLGEPFVGRAGQLLNKIIEACRLKREDVYILNMIKCRPPGNRNPLPHELTNCRGYLERQLDLIQPEFICCLGAVASQNLLNTAIPIGKLRGKLHAYRGAKVVCTFHPAYLLRNPAAKKDAWEDMKFLFREMGVEL